MGPRNQVFEIIKEVKLGGKDKFEPAAYFVFDSFYAVNLFVPHWDYLDALQRNILRIVFVKKLHIGGIS